MQFELNVLSIFILKHKNLSGQKPQRDQQPSKAKSYICEKYLMPEKEFIIICKQVEF